MSASYLDRESAPFGPEVWAKIDEAVVGAAKSQMSARRLLEIEGPHGLQLRTLAGPDEDIETDGGATVCLSPTIPVPTIRQSFTLPMRAVAAYETDQVMFNLRSVAEAAIAVAHREDEIILNGLPDHGLPGLLNTEGVATMGLDEWTEPGRGFENIMQAVNVLDDRGLHGPYSLALAPPLYNALFRLYPGGNRTEYEQLSLLITGGIVKADAIPGGVLLAVGKQYSSIVLGQDLMTAYVGPACGEFEFCIMESAALRVSLPQSIVILG